MAAHSTLRKKPGTKEQGGMKRPAAKEKTRAAQGNKKTKIEEPALDEEKEEAEQTEPPPLTEAALKNHEKFLAEMDNHKDMSQKQFDASLAKLPKNTSEKLWRAFESNWRETGTDGDYRDAAAGCGQLKKKGNSSEDGSWTREMSANAFEKCFSPSKFRKILRCKRSG